MGKRDVKWLKLLFEKKMFTKEATQVCNTLNPNLETDSDTDTQDDFTDADETLHAMFYRLLTQSCKKS